MTTEPFADPSPHSAEESLDVVHGHDKHRPLRLVDGSGTSEVAKSVLARAVQVAVGDDSALPRSGQHPMIRDVAAALETQGGHALAVGPTGSGKSLVYLSAAAASWATTQKRSIVSTESLALQAQITDKDAPVVAKACEDVTGLRPQVAVLKGWSNYACFDGDERFITSRGPRRFRDVVGTTVTVLDGNRQWTPAEIKSFGHQPITRLTVSRGGVRREILTTDEHRWFVNPNANDDHHLETLTRDLQPGDRLAYLATKPKITGRTRPSNVGICAGLVFGDGSRFRSTDKGMHSGAATIQLHGAKNIALLPHFAGVGTVSRPYERATHAEPIVRVDNLPSFFKDLPDMSSNSSYLYGWLAGYFAADGTVSSRGSASISSASRENLEFVMTLCDRLGISHGGHIGRQDRKGMNTRRDSTALYRLSIYHGSLTDDFFLVEEHRKRHQEHRATYRRVRSARRWKVEAVEQTGELREVFCAVVPTTASFALAGNILTGNCAASAMATAVELLEAEGRSAPVSVTQARKALGKLKTPDRDGVRGLTSWALEQSEHAGSLKHTGDKNSFHGHLDDQRSWDKVSVSSGDCVGADRCAFSELCLPRQARELAAEADIVVTNHTLLGVQAANSIPVIVGSRTLGTFHHLLIDEAHGLPGVVRDQGSVEVSGRAVRGVMHAIERSMDSSYREVESVLVNGKAVAAYVDDDLSSLVKDRGGRDQVARPETQESVLGVSEEPLRRWLNQCAKLVKGASKNMAPSQHKETIQLRRAEDRVARLETAIDLLSEDKTGYARWVELVTPTGRAAMPYPVARCTPVDVAPMLSRSLWTRPMTEEELDELPDDVPADVEPRAAMSVVALSATIPTGFARQAGLRAQPVEYASPFDVAYAHSVLFVPPSYAEKDRTALGVNWGGRVKFDVKQHRAWALEHIVQLVEANGGSALVLAATSTAGKDYAEALDRAARGRWNVFSQWDGVQVRRRVAEWKEDHSSVMVGTKSLMTGVDAAGGTCTLVIVDRPPRSPSNPVDDARVEQLVADAGMNKWAADTLVYVADAALLLNQAAGRLIRSVDDSGMVAVLDPRLLKSSPFAYAEPTRRAYLDQLHRFTVKMNDTEQALEWLRGHRK